eukprot:6213280-Pleurochrysis_carterae.AAC.2
MLMLTLLTLLLLLLHLPLLPLLATSMPPSILSAFVCSSRLTRNTTKPIFPRPMQSALTAWLCVLTAHESAAAAADKAAKDYQAAMNLQRAEVNVEFKELLKEMQAKRDAADTKANVAARAADKKNAAAVSELQVELQRTKKAKVGRECTRSRRSARGRRRQDAFCKSSLRQRSSSHSARSTMLAGEKKELIFLSLNLYVTRYVSCYTRIPCNVIWHR